ncbi:MAG: hypothetical protein DDT31_01692 [Syntrophomonadaceae bacterium]|nr:hypothetical protein [Bacillota bacterium]
MLSTEQKEYILSKAYVPEHIPDLMVPISKGEPSLADGYIYFSRDNWMIFVGYPLEHDFTAENLESALRGAIKKYQPGHIWLIAPEIPPSLNQFCGERESDDYYKIELSGLEIKRDLTRVVRKASKDLTVEKGGSISKEHMELISEFLKRERPNPLIRELFLSMQEYVKQSETAIVLNAFNRNGELTAFYVVELSAREFATYVVGCFSKKNYIPHASDLLAFELINLAINNGKGYVNLGLGVNDGIRRFKEKWGGVPFLRYEFCEYRPGGAHPKIIKMMKSLEERL